MTKEYQTMENRIAVLFAMADSRGDESITALCETWLKMFPLKPEPNFMDLSLSVSDKDNK